MEAAVRAARPAAEGADAEVGDQPVDPAIATARINVERARAALDVLAAPRTTVRGGIALPPDIAGEGGTS